MRTWIVNCSLCFAKSYPKTTSSWDMDASSASDAPLFSISHPPAYPTSKMIHSWLQKSRLSEQELGVEHVEMLLDILVFDGEIERLPAYGASMWDMGAMDENSEEERKERKAKRKREKAEEERRKKKAKGKKRARRNESSEDEDEKDVRKKKRRKLKEESDDSDAPKRKGKSKKKKKKKKKNQDSDDDSDSDSDSDDHSESDSDRHTSKKRKFKSSRSKSKSKSKRRSSSPSSDSDSDSDSEESDSSSTSRKRKKSSSKLGSKTKQKSVFDLDSEGSDQATMGAIGSANVYRAVRQERVSLGWSQAPCGRCPVFDFCHESGPVNPNDCTYYGDWLQQGTVEF